MGLTSRDFGVRARGLLHVDRELGRPEGVSNLRFRQLTKLGRRERDLERCLERFWGALFADLGGDVTAQRRCMFRVSFVN